MQHRPSAPPIDAAKGGSARHLGGRVGLLAWARVAALAAGLVGCARPSAEGEREGTERPAPAGASASPSAAIPERAAPPKPDPFAEEALLGHVRFLTSAELGGRRAGSPEERKAVDYVARAFERAGAGPLPGGLREQEVPLPRGSGASANVFGLIEGSNPALAGEYVVVGAHLDHLGVRRGSIHPGAEDNASGVSVLLALASALSSRRATLGRSVLLVGFGAEELGLIGSRRFVASPPLPLDRAASMVNIDMVGRRLLDRKAYAKLRARAGIRDDATAVEGTAGRPAFRRLVEDAFASAGLQVVAAEDHRGSFAALLERQTRGRSDHTPFEKAGIPALFFCSGEFDGYHEPSDVPEKLVPSLLARRARAILGVVLALAREPRLAAPAPEGAPAPPKRAGKGGAGP